MNRAATARAAPKGPPRTIIQAIDDPRLFGGMFDAPSWRPWRVFLKALQALPMAQDEFALYAHHTARKSLPVTPARYAQLERAPNDLNRIEIPESAEI